MNCETNAGRFGFRGRAQGAGTKEPCGYRRIEVEPDLAPAGFRSKRRRFAGPKGCVPRGVLT